VTYKNSELAVPYTRTENRSCRMFLIQSNTIAALP
jgi:hypothetical protein